jgi:hypothetical protein
VGKEDAKANSQGGECGEEDGGGGEVFGLADAGMVGEGDGIAGEFEGGVEGFGDPDEGDGEEEPAAVTGGDVEVEGCVDDEEGGECVEAGVGLRAEQVPKPREGAAETGDAAAEV